MQVDTFMTEIIEERWKKGQKIPSENELAQKYECSRLAIRKLFEQLEHMGYTYSMQGKGRYLKPSKEKLVLPLTGSESFTDKMKQASLTLETKITRLEKCQPTGEDAHYFPGEIYQIERLRIVEGEPIALHKSKVCAQTFKDLEFVQPLSMFAYYRQKGITSFESNESILTISFPTVAERELFQCQPLTPLQVISSDCFDGETKCLLERTTIIYRSDRFALQMESNKK